MFRKKSNYFYNSISNNLVIFWFKYLICLYNIKYYINKQIIILYNQNNKLYFFFHKKKIYNNSLKLINFLQKINFIYSSKIIIIGLGFKCFIYKCSLFLLLGFSHYILYKIPQGIKLFCKKKTIFLTSLNKQKLFLFQKLIQNSKKLNIYKGKGIIEFKQFKNCIKLKKGKKQQYI